MIVLTGKQLNSIYERTNRQFTMISNDNDDFIDSRFEDGEMCVVMLFKHNKTGKCYLVDSRLDGWPFVESRQYRCDEVKYSFKKIVVQKTIIAIDDVGEFVFDEC